MWVAYSSKLKWLKPVQNAYAMFQTVAFTTTGQMVFFLELEVNVYESEF